MTINTLPKLPAEWNEVAFKRLGQGVKFLFTRGHISLMVAFKGLNVTLGLYKCNYSLTVKPELGAAAG